MNEFVNVYNSGETPVLVGDKYVYPGQRQRVLRRYYEAVKDRHPSLILPDEKEPKTPHHPEPKEDVPSEVSEGTSPPEDDVSTEKPKRQKKS